MVKITSKDWTGLSSQIRHTFYDEAKEAMSVQFHNGKNGTTSTYQYTPVKLEVWEKSLKADSIGKFVNKEIKPNCKAFKIN